MVKSLHDRGAPSSRRVTAWQWGGADLVDVVTTWRKALEQTCETMGWTAEGGRPRLDL